MRVVDRSTSHREFDRNRFEGAFLLMSQMLVQLIDGTAKGGVVVAIRQQFELPVKYIGVGEKAEDLALFNTDQFVDDLLAEGYEEEAA